MSYTLGKILIGKDEIDQMVQRIADQISADYHDEALVVVGILKGSFIFMSDLIRRLEMPIIVDFMSVSSYFENTRSTGIVKIIKDMDVNIHDKHVLIVEDIIDSGLTLSHLKELLMTKEPKSLKVCVAFDKPDRRKTQIEADYVGMVIPDEFIVGYGLDYAEKYRNLSDIRMMVSDGGNK
jgi:hypoxanthine phosphoribosyltransferase